MNGLPCVIFLPTCQCFEILRQSQWDHFHPWLRKGRFHYWIILISFETGPWRHSMAPTGITEYKPQAGLDKSNLNWLSNPHNNTNPNIKRHRLKFPLIALHWLHRRATLVGMDNHTYCIYSMCAHFYLQWFVVVKTLEVGLQHSLKVVSLGVFHRAWVAQLSYIR